LTPPLPLFADLVVSENEPLDVVVPCGSIVSVTVRAAAELFQTCSGKTRNGSSPGDGTVFAVIGAVTRSPKLTFERSMSVFRDPPTLQAGSPLTPGVHAVKRLN
jgi:hypothetical protein